MVKYGMKKCTNCKIVKPFDQFYFVKRKSGNRYPIPACKECKKAQSRAYHADNREAVNYKQRRGNMSPERLAVRREADKRYLESLTPEQREAKREYHKGYHKNRLQNDPEYRFAGNLRSLLYVCLGPKPTTHKGSRSKEVLGMSAEDVRKKFAEIYGVVEDYAVDHFVPVSAGKTNAEKESLCHWTNLRPISKTDNLEKWAHLPTEGEFEAHCRLVGGISPAVESIYRREMA